MQIVLFSNFEKRENSTKRPVDGGFTVDVFLKDRTSLAEPVFIITGVNPNIFTLYNYCFAFNRYYFIRDIISLSEDVIEFHCETDYLATYKSEILNYTTFVERSASSYDVLIPDNLLSSQQDLVSKSSSATASGFDQAGLYVVPVSSKYGITLYCFDYLGNATAFFDGTLYKNPKTNQPLDLNKIDTLITTVGFHVFNINEYMGSMMWLPVSYSAYASAVSGIAVGMWDLNYAGYYELGAYEQNVTASISIPTNTYSDFRKSDPRFSKYSLWLPGVGEVGINSVDAGEYDLYADIMTDFLTGAVSYRIYHASGGDIACFNGQIGCEVPAGKVNINTASFVTSAIGTAVSVATASTGAGAIASGVSGAVATASAVLDPQVSISGGSGNKCVIQERPNIICTLENYGSKEFPTDDAGRPLMQNVQLSTLSGYVKCGNASLPISGLSGDKERVNSYLNSGFYVE